MGIETGLMIGGSMLASWLGSRSAKKKTQQTPQEAEAMGAQTGLARQLGSQGRQLFNMGMPALQQGSSYLRTLAGGNRAATSQLLAPDIENVNDVYGGAKKSLSRFLRGPEKDMQLGELERERAGGISRLFRDARPNAVSRLLDFGGDTTSQGMSAAGGAAGIHSGVQNSLFRNRYAGADLERQAGADYGNLFFQMMQMAGGGGGGGGGGGKGTSWRGFGRRGGTGITRPSWDTY